jgi:hypothetical protein
MEKGIDVELWIKDFVADEWNIKFIPNYLRACHKLRDLEGLKRISDAEFILQQLKRYKKQKEKEIKKKFEKGAKNDK